jgi:hypothetical protein
LVPLKSITPSDADIATRDDQIHRMRLDGVSLRAIARTFKIPVELVESVLDRACVKVDAQYRASTIAVELERLDEMHRVFYAKALGGDGPAAQVAIRIAEHRAAILGLFAPVRHDPVQLVEASKSKESSTDRIAAALEGLTGQPLSVSGTRVEPHPEPAQRARDAAGGPSGDEHPAA